MQAASAAEAADVHSATARAAKRDVRGMGSSSVATAKRVHVLPYPLLARVDPTCRLILRFAAGANPLFFLAQSRIDDACLERAAAVSDGLRPDHEGEIIALLDDLQRTPRHDAPVIAD